MAAIYMYTRPDSVDIKKIINKYEQENINKISQKSDPMDIAIVIDIIDVDQEKINTIKNTEQEEKRKKLIERGLLLRAFYSSEAQPPSQQPPSQQPPRQA